MRRKTLLFLTATALAGFLAVSTSARAATATTRCAYAKNGVQVELDVPFQSFCTAFGRSFGGAHISLSALAQERCEFIDASTLSVISVHSRPAYASRARGFCSYVRRTQPGWMEKPTP